QFVRTAAIELRRRAPEAICIALHPGTVETSLSSPFHKSGLAVRSPDIAARDVLNVITGLQTAQSGGFYDYMGQALPW
ncbi:MAG TPA: C-factor, partial [Asticcacaulis sp.]|nr:C-factor [Asticcacaulis sp.]